MNTVEFLRLVWPDTGLYCIATPQHASDGKQTWWKHAIFETIEEAAAFSLRACQPPLSKNIYFNLNTLVATKHFYPQKINKKTGDLGVWQVRTHENAKECRSFFLDLDVGNDEKTFVSQVEAIQELKKFLVLLNLPRPMLVSSGRGVHVYWPLLTAMDSTKWYETATKLKRLIQHYKFKADPDRISDRSSVLRVPGTLHLKDVTNPTSVTILADCGSRQHDNATFCATIDAAFSAANLTLSPGRTNGAGLLGEIPAHIATLASNIERDYLDEKPPSIKLVGAVCSQLRWMIRHPAKCNEPMWYKGLIGTLRFVEDGEKWIHTCSQGHPGYSEAECQAKIEQSIANQTGPTTCGTIAAICGEDRCKKCPFYGQPTSSPIVFARQKDAAPDPVIETHAESGQPITLQVQPPKGFTRPRTGGVALAITGKDGKEVSRIIYLYDLYPLDLIDDQASGAKCAIWRVVLPKQGTVDFVVPRAALYDMRELSKVLANAGMVPHAEDLPALRDYMIGYVAELQKRIKDSQQYAHLGWTDDTTEFILPDGILTPRGTRPALLTEGASQVSEFVRAEGGLGRQVELLRLYNKDARYVHLRFFIACSLGSPLLYMTNYHGAVVAAVGESGASKSTALYTAMSLWGHPERAAINGTTKGVTALNRMFKMSTLCNIPTCIDEITEMEDSEARDLALSVSQLLGRGGMRQSGLAERKQLGGLKSTIMLVTANNSLHEKLSMHNAAGTAASMRVFEIHCPKLDHLKIHEPWQIDEYFRELCLNYGHIGREFMRYVVLNRIKVEQRVRDMCKYVAQTAAAASAERYWVAVVACALVANQIAYELGLLSFDPAELQIWALGEQLPNMRNNVKSNLSTPLDVLLEYIEYVTADTLITQDVGQGMTSITQKPSRALNARFHADTREMWLALEPFRAYTHQRGMVLNSMLDNLQTLGVARRDRKILGKGCATMAHGRTVVISVDLTHPLVSGKPVLRLLDKKVIDLTQPPTEDVQEIVS